MKTLKTNKKFYNRWLFKVSIATEGVAIIRSFSLEKIIEIGAGLYRPVLAHHMVTRAMNNRSNILDLANYLLLLDSTVWTKRIENSIFDFYTNDRKLYDDFSAKFTQLVVQRFEPEYNTINLLEDSKIIICDKLPHNKYKYRVYLRPHKLAGDEEAKDKLLNWMISQSPKITCTTAIQHWFKKTEWNWDRRYVLVEDEGMLVMLKLRADVIVGAVYKYVIADK